jgi:hexosaminidase
MNKIYLMCLAFTASLLTWSSSFNIVSAQSPDVVIPVPAEVTMTKGTYKFEEEPKVKVAYSSKGFENPEAYSMKITPKGITIKASGDAGVFYARQTLMQMTADGTVKEIACCEIYDEPRFSYRGMHFDVSRHFRSLDFLKKQVDVMASFKMNRMHIHLTDAAGWRMQIDAYPRLCSFAAWRPQTTWKEWWNTGRTYVDEGTPGAYGGYYTKDEMRELVEYARQRHIEVIP